MADDANHGEKVLCFVCNNAAVRKRVYCADCKVWSHFGCANKKKCCDSGSLPNTPDIVDENSVKILIATINNLSQTVSEMKKEIGELIEENKKLRNDIETLKTGKTETNTPADRADVNIDERIFQEIEERQSRICNIVITNLPETHHVNGTESDETTRQSVEKLLTGSVMNNIGITKCFRIGRSRDASSPRPVKVVLSSADDVHKVLKSYKSANGIFINKDLTRMQQKRAFDIRQEFRNRTNEGETGIKLKYYSGIPKIIKVKN